MASPAMKPSPRLLLRAATAAELMTAPVLSISADASVKEAIAFLDDRGFSAAPVIDEAGRPVGVLSRSNIVMHDREKMDVLAAYPEYYHAGDLSRPSVKALGSGFEVVDVDRTRVRDIMTPTVFSVTPETSAARVIEEMLQRRIHRLFVVDGDGVVVGVVAALDVLRALRPE